MIPKKNASPARHYFQDHDLDIGQRLPQVLQLLKRSPAITYEPPDVTWPPPELADGAPVLLRPPLAELLLPELVPPELALPELVLPELVLPERVLDVLEPDRLVLWTDVACAALGSV